MVLLDKDLVLRALKRVSPSLLCSNNDEKFLIIRVVVLIRMGAVSRVEIDWLKNLEFIVLIEDVVIARPNPLNCRMIRFCRSKCLRMGVLVKAIVRYRDVSSACRVHSLFHGPCVYTKYIMEAVTLPYF